MATTRRRAATKPTAPTRTSTPTPPAPAARSGRHVLLEALADRVVPPGLDQGAFVGPWRGPTYHSGNGRMTPLGSRLASVHNAGIYVFVSGTLLWAARRLGTHTDVSPLLDVAEALFAFQQDARWFRLPARKPGAPFVDPDTLPRPAGAVSGLLIEVRMAYNSEAGRWPAGRMFGLATACHQLTRHNLPKAATKAFDDWTRKMVARLEELAPFDADEPDLTGATPARAAAWAKQVMGKPLPPSVLDLTRPPRPAAFAGEWKQVRAQLDWKHNPYLAKPR